MENFKKLSTEDKERFLEHLEDIINYSYDDELEENNLHHNAFNTDYWIIGTYEAEQFLSRNFGVFNAINIVREWEKLHIGEVAPTGSSEDVCNKIAYIIGQEIIYDLFQYGNNDKNSLILKIKNLLKK